MAYREQIPSADPNKDTDEVEDEALRAWALLKRGWSYDEIAVELKVSRRTVGYRLEKLIFALGGLQGPLRRMAELDRLERYTRRIDEALDDDLTPGDLAKLVGAGARVSDARLKLLAPAESAPDPEPDEQMTEWVSAAQAESEAELARVRGEEAS